MRAFSGRPVAVCDDDLAAALGASILLAPGRGADEVVAAAVAQTIPLAHGRPGTLLTLSLSLSGGGFGVDVNIGCRNAGWVGKDSRGSRTELDSGVLLTLPGVCFLLRDEAVCGDSELSDATRRMRKRH